MPTKAKNNIISIKNTRWNFCIVDEIQNDTRGGGIDYPLHLIL